MWSLIRTRDGSLRWNTIGNLAGRLVPAILTIVAVPILLETLGTEAYGIIGLYASVQVVFAFLDLGLSAASAREVAQNAARGGHQSRNPSLLRTLEVIYWLTGLLIGVLLASAAGWIATKWLNVQALQHRQVELSLVMMGLSVAARWPVNLYTGALQGMELQVTQNVITIGAAVLRTLGGLAVVVWISPTILAFMAWHAVASLCEVVAMMRVTWAHIGARRRHARFDLRSLKRLWRFALSFNAAGVLAMIVSNADKFVISKALPLSALGLYLVAVTATGAVPHIASAVSAAVFPRFAAQIARGDQDSLHKTYYQTARLLSFAVVPASLSVGFFSRDVLQLWTQSSVVADEAYIVLTLLAIAYLCNALYYVPFTLAMAAGHTYIILAVNAAGLPAILIASYLVIPRFGILGAATTWLTLMALNLVVYLIWIHKRLLGGELASYVRTALLPFLAVGFATFGIARVASSFTDNLILSLTAMMVALGGYLLWGLRFLPENVRGGAVATLRLRWWLRKEV